MTITFDFSSSTTGVRHTKAFYNSLPLELVTEADFKSEKSTKDVTVVDDEGNGSPVTVGPYGDFYPTNVSAYRPGSNFIYSISETSPYGFKIPISPAGFPDIRTYVSSSTYSAEGLDAALLKYFNAWDAWETSLGQKPFISVEFGGLNGEHGIFTSTTPMTGWKAMVAGAGLIDGDDIIKGSNHGDTLHGEGGNDKITGGKLIDDIDGGGANDVIDGGLEGDTLRGGDGIDLIVGGQGADKIDGGADIDILGYMKSSAITLDLAGSSSSGDAAGDTVDNIEAIVGSNFGDHITLGTTTILVLGSGGDDTITGSDQNDELHGDFNDVFLSPATLVLGVLSGQGYPAGGASGSDTIDGKGGVDTIYGGDGGDTLNGGFDADNLFGGEGDDFIGAYVWAAGIGPRDEKAGGNKLIGGGGSDSLNSITADVLVGDTLTGDGDGTLNPGADTFWVNNADRITDFEIGDTIATIGSNTIDKIVSFSDSDQTKLNFFTEQSAGVYTRALGVTLDGKFAPDKFRVDASFDGKFALITLSDTAAPRDEASISERMKLGGNTARETYAHKLADLAYDDVAVGGVLEFVQRNHEQALKATTDKFGASFGDEAGKLTGRLIGAYGLTVAQHITGAGGFDRKSSGDIFKEYASDTAGLAAGAAITLAGGPAGWAFAAGVVAEGIVALGSKWVSDAIDSYFEELDRKMLEALPQSGDIFRRIKRGDDQANGLLGDEGLNRLEGLGGDDSLTGGGKNDLIDGGQGNDKAYYSGRYADYNIEKDVDGNFNVADLRPQSLDGTDQLIDVETAVFADGTYDFSTGVFTQLAIGTTITGTLGNDIISPLETVAGQPLPTWGDDTVHGGAGDDTVILTRGNDTAYGEADNDSLSGQSGNDQLFGGIGNDVLDGGSGDDQLDGGEDNDTLFGRNGNDTMFGGAGNDKLLSGTGKDVMTGGAGADRFVVTNKDLILDDSFPVKVATFDTIADFDGTEGDLIDVQKPSDWEFSTNGTDGALSNANLPVGSEIRLAGVATFNFDWLV